MVNLVVVGGGSRGWALAAFALMFPERARIAALAEPRPERRQAFREAFGLGEGLFLPTGGTSWRPQGSGRRPSWPSPTASTPRRP
jgi:hypothetical protein